MKKPGKDQHQKLYDSIKKSFEWQNKKAPQGVWEGIKKQLNIDTVWMGISNELDRKPIYHWSNFRWAAALWLLLISLTGIYLLYTSNLEPSSITDETHNQLFKNQVNEDKNKTHNTEKETKNSKPKGAPLIAKTEASKDSFNIKGAKTLQLEEEKSIVLTWTQNTHATPSASLETESTSHLSMRNKDAIKQNSVPFAEILTLKSKAFDTLLVAYQPLLLTGLTSADANKTTKENDIHRFEVGLAFNYSNTWFLNNETRNSFDKESLISSIPTFTSNYGALVQYNLSSRSAVAMEVQFISKARQRYHRFTNGEYIRDELIINYTKIYASYQRNFKLPNKRTPTQFTAKAGIYSGFLQNKEGDLGNQGSAYSTLDYGFKLAVGQEKEIGKIIIGYGLNGERGVKNIFLGDERTPARFNKTFNLNLGAYLHFKYKL